MRSDMVQQAAGIVRDRKLVVRAVRRWVAERLDRQRVGASCFWTSTRTALPILIWPPWRTADKGLPGGRTGRSSIEWTAR